MASRKYEALLKKARTSAALSPISCTSMLPQSDKGVEVQTRAERCAVGSTLACTMGRSCIARTAWRLNGTGGGGSGIGEAGGEEGDAGADGESFALWKEAAGLWGGEVVCAGLDGWLADVGDMLCDGLEGSPGGDSGRGMRRAAVMLGITRMRAGTGRRPVMPMNGRDCGRGGKSGTGAWVTVAVRTGAATNNGWAAVGGGGGASAGAVTNNGVAAVGGRGGTCAGAGTNNGGAAAGGSDGGGSVASGCWDAWNVAMVVGVRLCMIKGRPKRWSRRAAGDAGGEWLGPELR